MPSNKNVSITNFNLGTGPANASVDISADWLDDNGVRRTGSRTGVTLAQLWNRPAITPEIKQQVLQELIWKLVQIDMGIE